jgi:hypothetical protein
MTPSKRKITRAEARLAELDRLILAFSRDDAGSLTVKKLQQARDELAKKIGGAA